MKAVRVGQGISGVVLCVCVIAACGDQTGGKPGAEAGTGGAGDGDGDGDDDSDSEGPGDGSGSSGGEGGSPALGGAGSGGRAPASGGDGANGPTEEPPHEGLVPLFVATGHLGRSLISCDDGRTWIADRAYDSEGDAHACGEVEPTRCNTEGYSCNVMVAAGDSFSCEVRSDCDCTHHPGSSQGVAYGNGVWVAAWGWGSVASVRRTTDGVHWEVVRDGMSPDEPFSVPTYTGVAYGNDVFVLGDRAPARSTDDGASWSRVAAAELEDQVVLSEGQPTTIWNARSFGFAEGVFLVTGSSGKRVTHAGFSCAQVSDAGAGCNSDLGTCEDAGGDCVENFPTQDLLLSRDDGESWVRPESLPRACQNGDIVGGNGVIVVAQSNGDVCYSTDRGKTFLVSNLGDDKRGTLVFTGSHFVAWTRTHRMTSTDAITWESTPREGNAELGAVSYNPETGTFVSIRSQWQRWYGDDAQAYRSSDGIDWVALETGAYPGGHSIEDIEFGWGTPSEAGCPAPEE